MFRRLRFLAVPFVLGAVAAGLVGLAHGALGDAECEEVSGTLTSTANFVNFTTQGTISGSLEGSTFFTGDAHSLAPVTSSSSPPLNPTDAYTGDLAITTKKGVLETRSVGVFELVPNGLGTEFDRVLSGHSTGKFSGATGHLFFKFRSDATGSAFTSTYTGEICS